MKIKIIKSGILNKFLLLAVVFWLGIMFRGYLLNTFYFFELKQEPLFFTEYFYKHIYLTIWGGLGFGLGNIVLFYILGYKLNGFIWGIALALLYAISPWTAYTDLFGGNNTYTLTWILLTFIAAVFFKESYKLSIYMLTFSLLGLLSSSIFGTLILIVILTGLFTSDYFNKQQKKQITMSSFVSACLLIAMLFLNMEATQNITKNSTNFFYDIGLVNSVNTLRGETSAYNLNLLGRLVENKYLYILEEFIVRTVFSLSPGAFFTPQHRLFNFSFSPPIYLGFIIPLAIGIYVVVCRRKYFFISMLLFLGFSIPSVIDKYSPNLSKLILASPIIFIYIGLGLQKILSDVQSQTRARNINRVLLILTIVIVLVQVLATLGDISLREGMRFSQFYN